METPKRSPSLAAAVPHDAARARDGRSLTVALTLSAEQLDSIAERVAELVQPAAAVSPWLSSEQAADYIAAPVSRIHDLVALRKLSPRRDGRRLLFRRDDLDAYLESGQ